MPTHLDAPDASCYDRDEHQDAGLAPCRDREAGQDVAGCLDGQETAAPSSSLRGVFTDYQASREKRAAAGVRNDGRESKIALDGVVAVVVVVDNRRSERSQDAEDGDWASLPSSTAGGLGHGLSQGVIHHCPPGRSTLI